MDNKISLQVEAAKSFCHMEYYPSIMRGEGGWFTSMQKSDDGGLRTLNHRGPLALQDEASTERLYDDLDRSMGVGTRPCFEAFGTGVLGLITMACQLA